MRNSFVILIAIAFFSCNDRIDLPKGILPAKKMEAVFWDMIRADIYTTGYTKYDSSRSIGLQNIQLQKSIFKEHQVTKEEFYNSYTYYSNHKELMTEMLDSMMAIHKRDTIKPKLKPAIETL